jgi:hypothetical protein
VKRRKTIAWARYRNRCEKLSDCTVWYWRMTQACSDHHTLWFIIRREGLRRRDSARRKVKRSM